MGSGEKIKSYLLKRLSSYAIFKATGDSSPEVELLSLQGSEKGYCTDCFPPSSRATSALSLLFGILILLLVAQSSVAQTQFSFGPDYPVEVDGTVLSQAWAGGLNSGQYGEVDLNFDGVKDLVIFDRSSNRLNPFIKTGDSYQYVPDYAYFFPADVNGWVVFRDFNCDGKNDLFTDTLFGIKVYLNSSTGTDSLSWTLVADPIFTEGFSGQINLQVNISDIPAIEDIDGDGDLDILVYDFAIGGYIRYHQNLSVENYGTCDSLEYRRVTQEWGDFMECSCNQFAFGEEECPPFSGGRLAHAGGKSMLALDLDGDGDMEFGLGQEACNTFYMLENIGSPDTALFRDTIPMFPDESTPLSFPEFPGAFYLDLDFDGTRDLISAPNVFANSADNSIDFVQSSWFYRNTGSAEVPNFEFVQDDFLQNTMIDLGEDAVPAMGDIDRDGDMDLLVGNRGKLIDGEYYATLHLFENIGSSSSPRFRLVDSDYLGLGSSQITHLKPYFTDLDNDEVEDLVFATANRFGFAQVRYIPGQSQPGFDLSNAIQLNLEIKPDDKLAFGDLDQDLTTDLVVGRVEGRVEYWEGGNNLVFTLSNDQLAGIGNDSRFRHPAPLFEDFSGDGQMDLMVADASGQLRLFDQRSGDTDFDPEQVQTQLLTSDLWAGTREIRVGARPALASADINGDGLLELALGGRQGGLFILGNTATGVGENLRSETRINLRVYPNPSAGLVRVMVNQDTQVEIISILGQKMLEEIIIKGNEEYQLDVRHLPGGVYLVQARGQTGRSVQKLIIQR